MRHSVSYEVWQNLTDESVSLCGPQVQPAFQLYKYLLENNQVSGFNAMHHSAIEGSRTNLTLIAIDQESCYAAEQMLTWLVCARHLFDPPGDRGSAP